MLTVMPSQLPCVVMADLDGALGEDRLSHRVLSPSVLRLRCRADAVPGTAPLPRRAQLLPHRQRRRQHQQNLEQRQAEHHAQPGGPENECDGQSDRGDDQQPGGRVQRHLLLQRMVLGGDRRDRTLHEHGVEQTERSPTPKKTPTITWPATAADPPPAAVSATQMTSSRTGRKATEGNTNGASCAGVVTAFTSILRSRRAVLADRSRGPPSVSEGDQARWNHPRGSSLCRS